MNFDPIAYDNIKYLFEGHLYDLDIDNQLVIVDRNDFINQAKWQKEYNITIKLTKESDIYCKFYLQSQLMNIASELLPIESNANLCGVHFQMDFEVRRELAQEKMDNYYLYLRQQWGDTRKVEVKKIVNFNTKETVTIFSIVFDRLIFENQMEDLIDLVEVALESIIKLQSI